MAVANDHPVHPSLMVLLLFINYVLIVLSSPIPSDGHLLDSTELLAFPAGALSEIRLIPRKQISCSLLYNLETINWWWPPGEAWRMAGPLPSPRYFRQTFSSELLLQRPSILYNFKLLWTFSPQITSQPRYGIVAASLDGVIHASGGNVGADTGEWRHLRQKYSLHSYFVYHGTHAIHITLSNLWTPRSFDSICIQYS